MFCLGIPLEIYSNSLRCGFLLACLQSWLRMYGYLPQASRQMSTMRSAQILSNAISDMQRFYGLEITGRMDTQTIRLVGCFSCLCTFWLARASIRIWAYPQKKSHSDFKFFKALVFYFKQEFKHANYSQRPDIVFKSSMSNCCSGFSL